MWLEWDVPIICQINEGLFQKKSKSVHISNFLGELINTREIEMGSLIFQFSNVKNMVKREA